ncbi:hypothetical protein GGI08_003830 [Coemansia sp. S2]|nr:hypothetical protein GGI08_003830 [Coemansia sp. S2]
MNNPHSTPPVDTVGGFNQLFTSEPCLADKQSRRRPELEQKSIDQLFDDRPDVWGHSRHSNLREDLRHIADEHADELADVIAQDLARDIGRPPGAESELQTGRARRFDAWSHKAAAGNAEEKEAYGPFKDIVLYCAVKIQRQLQGQHANRLAEARNRRLILPFHTTATRLEGSDETLLPDVTLCFEPVGTVVAPQAHNHYCFAGIIVECKKLPTGFQPGLKQLSTYTLEMFRNQLDRKDAIGMVLYGTFAKVVVFGLDAVWASTGANLATPAGRRTFIRQLVDWSTCPVYRLGLDTNIHRLAPPPVAAAPPPVAAAPPLEEAAPPPLIVYRVDIGNFKLYSRECRLIADTFTGQRRRYILLWRNIAMAGPPSHLLVDDWPFSAMTSRYDTRDEAGLLRRIRANFANNDDLRDAVPRVIIGERVRQRHGRHNFVDDDTLTSYGPLTSFEVMGVQGWLDGHFRAHKRILIEYPGEAVSEADNEQTAALAIARAMVIVLALYTRMNILHRGIDANNITYLMVGGRLQIKLLGFNNSIDVTIGDERQLRPEIAVTPALLSICSLYDLGAVYTLLDDLEPFLNLSCWLGTFGVNRAQRTAYAARHTAGLEPRRPIKNWNQGTAADIAEAKRLHVATEDTFHSFILSKMRNGPLRRLAEAMYRVLFLHPGCYGTALIANERLEQVADIEIRDALSRIPAINGMHDSLVLRNAFREEFLANLADGMAGLIIVARLMVDIATFNREQGLRGRRA